MDLYFDAGILQVPHFTGCQVYAENILAQMADIAPQTTFHLHFAMDGWNPRIDELLKQPNMKAYRYTGPVGRHVLPPLNIARTRSRAYYMMNGNTGAMRVPVPCPTAALFHDMRLVLCKDIYGAESCDAFAKTAREWIYARDCIITGAETVKQEIMEFFKLPAERIVVASESTDHHPADGPESRPEKLPQNRPYFLMVNPGEIRKNWQDVLDAFAIYLRQHEEDKETVLVFAGNLRAETDPVAERLKKDAVLAERTILLGYITDEELRYLYRNARFMLYPSKYEGFGIPTLEAMGQNCPVILSDIPVFREVAVDAALFVPIGKPAQMAEAMYELHTDEDKRRDLVARGQKRVAAYSWRASAKKTLDVLTTLK
jgi:glycosyltransferase involved in cell wall biosynthesis